MRRYALVLLFFFVLIGPFLLRATVISSPAQRSAPVSGDALPLVIVTPNPEGVRREFADAFTPWHQKKYGRPAEVEYRSYGGTNDVITFLRSSRDSFKQLGSYEGIDLAWGGGDVSFNIMKSEGFLQPVSLPPAEVSAIFPQRELGGLPLYDTSDPPLWYGTALAGFGIAFNRDVARYLGVSEPQTWRDLTDPRWRSWVVLADPTRSGSATTVFMTIVERAMQDASNAGRSEDDGWAEGMGLIRQIAANARLFTDSASSLPAWVSSGDVGASSVIDFYALAQIDAVGIERMAYVQPYQASAVNPDPIAMLAGAPDRETAIHFVEFVLSRDGQALWYAKPGTPGGPRATALYRMPVRSDVYRSDPRLAGKPDLFTATGTFNSKRSREKTFGILPALIQASCMDTLEELREARRAILAAGRSDLDAKLAKFPFDQQEALQRMNALDALRNKPADQLAMLRQWTEEFRAEYRALKEEAGG